ncbi:MAG: bifunctional diguanylate cyclase/phosphodiesterase [Nitrosomonadales bacterium]|nr:bifunctional diguanylate cyclase/phosphodiesterase [Nitrosomonadales bacterium]
MSDPKQGISSPARPFRKALRNANPQLTLGKLLVLVSALSLALGFTLIFFLSSIVRDHAVHQLAHDDARQTSKLVFQSLYAGMRKGWDKQEIADTIKRLNESFPDIRIKVYRGEIVTRQFGGIAGEADIIGKDPALSQALSSGQDALLFPDDDNIRYLYPLTAKQECLACHTQSSVGAVHGVIDILYPIETLKVSFSDVINSLVGYTLLIMGLVFFILYLQLNYFVAMPIATLAGVMRRMTMDMDLTHRFDGSMRLLELKQLAKYFNRLLKTIRDYNVRLEELSVRDPLTGLFNRRKFQEFLQHEIIMSTRHQRGFSVIMVDLDNFKYINDTFGHPVGDMVLKELAAMLSEQLRRGDVLARMGGDEFAIILPETLAKSGLQVTHKLHQTLADKEFDLPVGKIRSTASFSMVSFPEDGTTEEALYSAMDVVLYKAKKHGKNQVMTAETNEDRSMMAIFKQGDFLRNAMNEDRIEAFMQPIINVQTGEVFAFEVLMRIVDGNQIIPADHFVDVAEELGMAKELDRIVFRKGLAHYAKVAAAHPQVKLFFNLFPRSFSDLEWIRGIPELARSAGVPCESMVLEITEREALPHLNQVRSVIEDLRARNISVALDDFGSGFSSFLYLKYLTVDYVKIEGSFVQKMADDERDRIIVEQINDMAHRFGIKTVAEFVEDEATAEILVEIGVDYVQGYFYGRPALPE